MLNLDLFQAEPNTDYYRYKDNGNSIEYPRQEECLDTEFPFTLPQVDGTRPTDKTP